MMLHTSGPRDALAAVFDGGGSPLTLRRLPLPELAEGEVLAKVRYCTLCGSDLHTAGGKRSTPTPTILGHEILGEVFRLPPSGVARDLNGRSLAVGDRIAWSVAVHSDFLIPAGIWVIFLETGMALIE